MKKAYVLFLVFALLTACGRDKKIPDVKDQPADKQKEIYGGVYTHRVYSIKDDVSKDPTSLMPIPGTTPEDLKKESPSKVYAIDRAIRDPNTGLLESASTKKPQTKTTK